MSAVALAEPAEAREPAELRGRGRDDVRLLVSSADGRIEHAGFEELPELLDAVDLLVINTSGTLPAAVRAGGELRVHVSAPATGPSDGSWLVELRRGSARFDGGSTGQVLRLPGGATATLLERHDGGRLWRASLQLDAPVPHYLARHGEPIRYAHADRPWPLERYQTVYATEAGSAEMPSAGRAFTPELVTKLVAAGIDVAPIVLHTGVSSLEAGEVPHAEWYRVPRFTAERVNLAHMLGGRVIAVGTTVVRALESAAAGGDHLSDLGGPAAQSEGWTELVIEPDSPIRTIDGLLSGFHDRDSSHLSMLEAIGGRELLERAYEEAASAGYLRHEFGDLHLILP